MRQLKSYVIQFVVLLLFSGTAYAEFQEHFLAVEGGHIKYYQIGQGRPVLLLHGLFADKEQWLGVVQKLRDNDPKVQDAYQFIIPDLVGHGGSTAPVEAYNLTAEDKKSLSQVGMLTIPSTYDGKPI